ncbi:MAG: hypothetical protein J3K34DRAFT_471291 [Monoraphidium minutum]|nr:MAG: hypothetical protein J3K34DRAFT_471291 [Monoraphidium minutum]
MRRSTEAPGVNHNRSVQSRGFGRPNHKFQKFSKQAADVPRAPPAPAARSLPARRTLFAGPDAPSTLAQPAPAPVPVPVHECESDGDSGRGGKRRTGPLAHFTSSISAAAGCVFGVAASAINTICAADGGFWWAPGATWTPGVGYVPDAPHEVDLALTPEELGSAPELIDIVALYEELFGPTRCAAPPAAPAARVDADRDTEMADAAGGGWEGEGEGAAPKDIDEWAWPGFASGGWAGGGVVC